MVPRVGRIFDKNVTTFLGIQLSRLRSVVAVISNVGHVRISLSDWCSVSGIDFSGKIYLGGEIYQFGNDFTCRNDE